MKQRENKVLMVAAAVVMTWSLAGCQYNGKQAVPGPPTLANTYDTLVTAQAALKQAKKEFGTDPAAKAPLNSAIDAYNIAEHTWKSWNAAGGGDTADAQILQQELTALVAAIASLEKDFGHIKLQDFTVDRELQTLTKI